MHIPGNKFIRRVYRQFSPVERGAFGVAALILIIGVVGLLGQLQAAVSTSVPVRGGSLHEGIVGFPRYVNPVLASTNADRDITALVYAGLTRIGTNGNVELDLARDFEISEDGSRYTFHLREDVRFHDGHPLQAEDVVYTINMLQDQRVDSPLAADWNNVSVQATDDHTVVFDLNEPFGDFIYNTRVGILPKHLWSTETADTFAFSSLNTSPIGAGPYQIADIKRNNEGLPTQYELTAFGDYSIEPFIQKITLSFFTSTAERDEAFTDGDIEAVYGLNPKKAANLQDGQVIHQPLTRIFAVFFNQNSNEALVETRVREALASALDKQRLVDEVLSGYGQPLSGPLPSSTDKTASSSLREARDLLAAAGWSEGEDGLTKDGETFSIELTTAEVPSLRATADYIANRWRELGITVSVSALPVAQLSQEVIRPRNYEALLFGQSINHGRDLYPFWHSSQLDDPGLNLAMYANSNVDALLENYRQATSSDAQSDIAKEAASIIAADQPAIFLYTPDFLYVVPENLKGVALPPIAEPADRFVQITSWYSKATNIWNVFMEDESEPEKAATSTSAGM